jgi:hypothetical protein
MLQCACPVVQDDKGEVRAQELCRIEQSMPCGMQNEEGGSHTGQLNVLDSFHIP